MRASLGFLGLVAAAALSVGCGSDSDDDDSSGGSGQGGTTSAGQGGQSQAGGGGSAGGTPMAGAGGGAGKAGATGMSGAGAGGASAGGASGGAGSSGAGMAGAAVAGTGGNAGSGATGDDELDNVFNLVDADAEAELEAFLTSGEGLGSLTEPGAMVTSVNAFLKEYLEVYDFLFFMTDHLIETDTYGKYEGVNLDIMVGTGSDYRWRIPGYTTDGHTRGVMGFTYQPGGYGPFGHEFMHHWAVYLDESFGFGIGKDYNDRVHWGYTDVHGLLGGYDPAHFECETPAGAMPPACTATSSGRYRYSTSFFVPNTGVVGDLQYAPLELYLMGLLPKSEVPDIHVLDNAELLDIDSQTMDMTVEADGMHTVTVADIIARHGEVPPLPADKRAFRVAMIVVSAEPADPTALAEIAHAMARFGNRGADDGLPSLEYLTGGRATLDTRLGPRRAANDPPPVAVPLPPCDLLEQDCTPPEAGCYLLGENPYCSLSGGAMSGETCDYQEDCMPGLTCASGSSSGPTCTPLCEPEDTASTHYCGTLCPNDFLSIKNVDGDVLSGFCVPE